MPLEQAVIVVLLTAAVAPLSVMFLISFSFDLPSSPLYSRIAFLHPCPPLS